MRRIGMLLVALAVAVSLLAGCEGIMSLSQKQHTATFLDLFDTVTTIVGFAETEEKFLQKAQTLHNELLTYHQLFDIYKDYDGINNLKTVNDQAGIIPVKVDQKIIQLLLDCKHYYELTDGNVNVAMGNVLFLWHKARNDGIRDPENAQLPDMMQLQEAAKHMDFANVEINEEASTVYITDPECSLDVGAIAKGWASQRVAETAPEGMLISVGGNICATGAKKGDNPWVIGIQNPNGDDNLHTIHIKFGTVVTSGDYQRTYTVEGQQYHHIIDPNTQMPAKYWRSVTVVCQDSGLADALSTALFLLPLDQGQALAEECGVDAMWVDHNSKEFMTAGFQNIIHS